MNSILIAARLQEQNGATEWSVPSHEEVNLATVTPSDLGLDWFDAGDSKLIDAIETAHCRAEKIAKEKANNSPSPDVEEIRRAFNLLKSPGEAVELRSPASDEGTRAGFYGDSEELIKDTHDLSALAGVKNVYWTLQRLKPTQAQNRCAGHAGFGVLTRDEQVEKYLWLPIDFDPVRNCLDQAVSSTDAEKAAAFALADVVRAWLAHRGFTSALCDSGNGAHLLVRIDLAVNASSVRLIESLLKGIAAKFQDSAVKIDTGVFNPSRIWKVYGTVARKGPHTPERPWRVARIIDAPQLAVASEDMLRGLPSDLPKESVEPKSPPTVTGDRIPHGQHDTQLHRIAGRLRYDGLEEEAIYNALVEVCEKRCDGLGSDWLAMCRKHATNICKKPVGKDDRVLINGQQVPDYRPLLDLSENKTSWILQNVQKASDLSAEPLTWVVEEMILEHGLHLFSGPQGSMKSMFAVILAKAIASGEAVMDRKNIGKPVTVVYVDRENPQAEMRRRCFGLGLLPLENFRIWGDWEIDNPPPVAFDDPRLIESAKRDNALFIFDSLSSYLDGADENNTGEMMAIMGKARTLARACAGVIILHHSAKKGTGSRGNTAISASTDMAFCVEKEGNVCTLSEERFRCCGPYKASFEMDFGGCSGVYSYRVRENGFFGARAIASPVPDAKEIDLNEANFIQRAKEEIAKAFEAGESLNQRQLATLVGITSNRDKTRLLNGDPERPWKCIPKGRSTTFLPK